MIPVTIKLRRKVSVEEKETETQQDIQNLDDILGDILGKGSDRYCIEGEIIVKTLKEENEDEEVEEDTYKDDCINNRIYDIGRQEINRTIINRMKKDDQDLMNKELNEIRNLYKLFKRMDISGRTTWYKKRKKDMQTNVIDKYIHDEMEEGRIITIQPFVQRYHQYLIDSDMDYMVEQMDKTYERLINSLELFNRKYGLNMKLYELSLDNILEE